MRFQYKNSIYLKKPYHERESNENLNRLLREYVPKKTSFSKLSQMNLKSYVSKINNRPKNSITLERV